MVPSDRAEINYRVCKTPTLTHFQQAHQQGTRASTPAGIISFSPLPKSAIFSYLESTTLRVDLAECIGPSKSGSESDTIWPRGLKKDDADDDFDKYMEALRIVYGDHLRRNETIIKRCGLRPSDHHYLLLTWSTHRAAAGK